MILHVLCLFMVMISSVISAPGMNATNDMQRSWKEKSRPKMSGTLDSIGGGHLLRAESPEAASKYSRSLELLVNSENNVLQKTPLVAARKEKQKPSSSGTLDPLGGGNLLRIVDPEAQTDVLRSLDSLLENQNDVLQKISLIAREEKQKPSSSGTLDPIGGGNLVRLVNPEAEIEILRSLDSLLESQNNALQKAALNAREEKQKHSSSGTLDRLGGGHLLRAESPEAASKYSESLELLVNSENDVLQKTSLVAREEKQKPSSSGTLDPLGGGNFVRIDDPEAETEVLRSLDSLLENQNDALQKIALIVREEKQKPSSSGTLDPIGGGNLVRLVDPEAEIEILRSSHSLLENQNDVLQKIALIAREEKQKPSSSGTLDPIGGGNLVRLVDPEAERGILRSMDSLLENQKAALNAREEKQKHSSSGTLDPLGGGHLLRAESPEVASKYSGSQELLVNSENDVLQKTPSVAREEKQKPSSSGTLDPLGGGNLVRIVDPEAETEVLRSLDSLLENQGRQNMMRLAREDKSTQRSSHALDGLGGVTGVADPYKEQMFPSLGRSHLVDPLDQGGDVLKMLDSISGRELLSSLDSAEGMAVLSALRKTHKYPKRMLDSVSGWAFGTNKRNFDEIDNVGFTGFAKRSPYYRQLALAKKNFDEIDRAGFETYNKRDFDEIDRTGFETFDKRDRKE